MRVPTRQAARLERAKVSAEACTANQSAPFSMTVRQTPAHDTEAPSARSSMSRVVAMTKVVSPPGLIARTSPISVTMPVNISRRSRQGFEHIGAKLFEGKALEARRGRKARHTERLDRWETVAAEQGGRMEPGKTIDEV